MTTKTHRIKEKYKDNLGQDIEVDFKVEQKQKTFKTRNRYPCGSADENWNEESQDWEP